MEAVGYSTMGGGGGMTMAGGGTKSMVGVGGKTMVGVGGKTVVGRVRSTRWEVGEAGWVKEVELEVEAGEGGRISSNSLVAAGEEGLGGGLVAAVEGGVTLVVVEVWVILAVACLGVAVAARGFVFGEQGCWVRRGRGRGEGGEAE